MIIKPDGLGLHQDYTVRDRQDQNATAEITSKDCSTDQMPSAHTSVYFYMEPFTAKLPQGTLHGNAIIHPFIIYTEEFKIGKGKTKK